MREQTGSISALERMARVFSQCHPNMGVACSAISADADQLLPQERSAVERAVIKRQREFATGRTNARRAMEQIGAAPRAIPSGADRAPVWPQGLIGSISHTDTGCMAVVGHKAEDRSVGIDLEHDRALDPEAWPTICTAAEAAEVRRLAAEDRGRWVTRLFSAKEAVFKWQYPLTGLLLDFQQIQVSGLTLDPHSPFVPLLLATPSLSVPSSQSLMEAGWVLSWACNA